MRNVSLSAIEKTSSSAMAERLNGSVGWFWSKVEDWNWETIFFLGGGDDRSTFNHCDVIGQ